MFQHIVDDELACLVGVDGALMLNNIAYWVFHNESNGRNFKDGRYWTYNTERAFIKLFPFWSRQNIRTIFRHLIGKGWVLKGCYNQDAMNHTSWYALTDKALEFFRRADYLKSTNRTVDSNQSNSGLESANHSNHNGSSECIDLTNRSVESSRTKGGLNPTGRVVENHLSTSKQITTVQGTTHKTTSMRGEGIEPTLPFDRLPDSPLKKALLEYRRLRRGTTSPLTEYTEGVLLHTLETLAPGNQEKQIAIVNRSLVNGWKDFYQLREDERKHSAPKPSGAYHPVTASEAAEQAGQGALALVEQFYSGDEKGDMSDVRLPF